MLSHTGTKTQFKVHIASASSFLVFISSDPYPHFTQFQFQPHTNSFSSRIEHEKSSRPTLTYLMPFPLNVLSPCSHALEAWKVRLEGMHSSGGHAPLSCSNHHGQLTSTFDLDCDLLGLATAARIGRGVEWSRCHLLVRVCPKL